MNEITLQIDDDQLRNIVIDDLKDTYRLAYKCTSQHEEDIKARKKILKHLKSVIRYYSNEVEYKEWKENTWTLTS